MTKIIPEVIEAMATWDMGPGHRTDRLAKIGYMCIEADLEDKDILINLIFADDHLNKFVGRPDRISKLESIIEYCRNKKEVKVQLKVVCDKCGALLGDIHKHIEWHSELRIILANFATRLGFPLDFKDIV